MRIATERGRSILARLDAPLEGDLDTGIVRLDRFVRQALKAHLERDGRDRDGASIGRSKRIELMPAVDVSMAHDLVPHLKKVLVESRTPASVGAVLYIPFPNSHAGTTYEVHRSADGPGYVDEDDRGRPQLSRLASSRGRLRRHLRGRRRARASRSS